MLTQERLKQVMHYNPSIGIFTGLIARGKRTDCIGRKLGNKPNHNGYIQISIDYKRYLASRLAWLYMTGELPNAKEFEIDHRNRNRSDNKWANLRLVTHQQNAMNSSIIRNNTSGILGVSFDTQTNLWRASISPNGKMLHLGRFAEKDDAIKARITAEKQYFGEYAGRTA